MGELALYLARTKGGVIDFGGALIAASVWRSEGPSKLLWIFERANWADISEPCEQFLGSLPGRVVGIPYRTANGRTWVTHMCDVEFLEAWLKHPDFHMIN